jgi:hypothetical protein
MSELLSLFEGTPFFVWVFGVIVFVSLSLSVLGVLWEILIWLFGGGDDHSLPSSSKVQYFRRKI